MANNNSNNTVADNMASMLADQQSALAAMRGMGPTTLELVSAPVVDVVVTAAVEPEVQAPVAEVVVVDAEAVVEAVQEVAVVEMSGEVASTAEVVDAQNTPVAAAEPAPSVADQFAALASIGAAPKVAVSVSCLDLAPFAAPTESRDEKLAATLSVTKARAALVEWHDARAAALDGVTQAIAVRDGLRAEVDAHRTQAAEVLEQNLAVIETLQTRYAQTLAQIDQDGLRQTDVKKIGAKLRGLIQIVAAAPSSDAQKAIVVHYYDAIGSIEKGWTERHGVAEGNVRNAFQKAADLYRAARAAGFAPVAQQVVREMNALIEACQASFVSGPAVVAAATRAKANLDAAAAYQAALEDKIHAIGMADTERLGQAEDAIEAARAAVEGQLVELDDDPALIGLDDVVAAAKELTVVDRAERFETVLKVVAPYKSVFALDIANARERVNQAEARRAFEQAEARRASAQKNRSQEAQRRLAEVHLKQLVEQGALTVGGQLVVTTWPDSRDARSNREDKPQLVIWAKAGSRFVKAEVHTATDATGSQWDAEYLPLDAKGRQENDIPAFSNKRNIARLQFDPALALVNHTKISGHRVSNLGASIVAAAAEAADVETPLLVTADVTDARHGKSKASRRAARFQQHDERRGGRNSKGRSNSRGGLFGELDE